MKKKRNILISTCCLIVMMIIVVIVNQGKEYKDDGIDTGIVMENCTLFPNQYGLVFKRTDKTMKDVKGAKLLKVTINDERAEVNEVKDEAVVSDLSEFIGEDVLYYANLSNSFEYKDKLDIEVFMEITLKNGDKVTQKFTDKIKVDGYGGY